MSNTLKADFGSSVKLLQSLTNMTTFLNCHKLMINFFVSFITILVFFAEVRLLYVLLSLASYNFVPLEAVIDEEVSEGVIKVRPQTHEAVPLVRVANLSEQDISLLQGSA